MLNVKQNILKSKSNIAVSISIWLIVNIYKNLIRPKIVTKKNIICSFYPTCSEYGILALNKCGFLKGWIKTIYRIKRCNRYRHTESCIDYP